MKIIKSKVKDIILILVLVLVFIIGTLYDFKISDKMYRGGTWFNYLFAALAKMPIAGISVYAFLCLFFAATKKENKYHKICLCIIYAVGAIVSSVLMFEDLGEMFINNAFRYIIALALGCFLIIYLYINMKKEDYSYFYMNRKVYLIIVISFVGVILSTSILKEIIARDRFETILTQEGVFTNWYQIGNGGDSCPSGHCAMSLTLISAIPFFKTIKGYKINDWIIYGIIFMFFIITAYTRISFGKHYLSDVVLGGIIAFLISKIVTFIMLGIEENKLEIKEGSLLDKIL